LMADWIKMRSSLLTNPKVIRMARALLQDPEFMEWMCPGFCVTSDESVTKRHVPVVTRIVVGALLPTWSAVNDTAARDGVVRHAASRDIDETAGVPGFGKALMAVEWLKELPDARGVQFINFEEHNSPQKERALTAKSSAERQAEYRARKKSDAKALHNGDAAHNGERDVTGDVTSDGREEKSREEKNNTPPPPNGGGTVKAGKKSRSAKKVGETRVPATFVVTPEMQAWAAEKAPLIDWKRETENFRDWEFKHLRNDWPATWRTWMRKAQTSAEETTRSTSRSDRSAADWTGGAL
jgi:hypothetical protein